MIKFLKLTQLSTSFEFFVKKQAIPSCNHLYFIYMMFFSKTLSFLNKMMISSQMWTKHASLKIFTKSEERGVDSK